MDVDILIAFLGVGAALVGVAFGVRHRLRRADSVARAMSEVALELGLEHLPPGERHARRLRGKVDGLEVEVEARGPRRTGTDGYTRLAVAAPGQIPAGLKMRQPVWLDRMSAVLVATGDAEFDAVVAVEGDVVEALALLGPEARTLVRRIVAGLNGQVVESAVTCDLEEAIRDPRLLLGYLRPMIELGRKLSWRGRQPSAQLAFNVRHEPQPAVRRRNLATLVERFPADPVIVATARQAAGDSDPAVRLRAAVALGDRAAAPALRPLLAEQDPELLTVAAWALGELGDLGAEAGLSALLGRAEEPVLAAAAAALGRVGGIAAVEPLVALAGRASASGAVRRAARAAVGEIQTRLGDVEPGRLSLAPGAASGQGALSVAEEPGKLSLAPAADPKKSA